MNKMAYKLVLSGALFGVTSLPALAVLAPALVLQACGGAKPAEAPAAAGSASGAPAASASASTAEAAPPASASASASASAAPQAAPLGTVLITDSSIVQKLFDAATAAPAAKEKTGPAAASDPLAKGIKDLAKQQATGMEADGPLYTGKLKEKEHLHADITLKSGKCYALVGFSNGVKDLDVHLLLPPGILSAQDITDDNKPVVGKSPDGLCPSASTPVTYKVDILADQGGGEVAVQLYSKASK
jgi:hypothetical protein